MQRDEPLDSEVHNSLLSLHKQGNEADVFMTRLTATFRRYLTPLRSIIIALGVLLVVLIQQHYSSYPNPPTFPLPVACCVHTSYHPRLQIVAVGDSITERGYQSDGWMSLLSNYYVRHADIHNRGYSGYNTRTYLALLHQHIQLNLWPYQPIQEEEGHSWKRLVTLYLGTNDASLPNSGTNESRIHTPLDEFHTNLRSIIAQLVPQYGAYLSPASAPPSHYLSKHTALILITPGQHNITAWQLHGRTPPYPPISSLSVTRSLDHSAHYAAAVRLLASEWHIPCLDMWSLTGESEWQRLFSDGLHLSEAGNRVLYEGVMAVIREKYSELQVRGTEEETEDEVVRLEWDAPVHRHIEYKDITGSFAVKATEQ